MSRQPLADRLVERLKFSVALTDKELRSSSRDPYALADCLTTLEARNVIVYLQPEGRLRKPHWWLVEERTATARIFGEGWA